MYDFDDVNPKKKDEEQKESVENAAETSAMHEEQKSSEVEQNLITEEEATEKEMNQTDDIKREEPKYQDDFTGPCVREYCYEEQVKPVTKKKKGWAKFIAACLIVSIVGGSSVGISYGITKQYLQSQKGVTSAPAAIQRTSGGGNFSAVDIVKAVKPSVVSVSTKITGMAQYFGAFRMPYEASGVGSGVIFYSDNDRVAIATNNHVIENANAIYVTFEGDINVPAKVIGTKSENDLAVLTVSWNDLRKAGIEHVTTAVFGDSEALEVGETVIAIGNAMGMGLSATDGIISMKEQNIQVDGNTLSVLQTSAAINSGNSGGALVNSAGEVIGINTAKYNSSMAEGMGYAIPSNVITPIVEELLTSGTMPKPYIGIVGTNITEENAPLYQLPVGALIMEVVADGPAEKAGLQVGDVITQYDGKTVMDMETLVELVNGTEIGKTVTIHVVRDGEQGIDLQMKIVDKNNG